MSNESIFSIIFYHEPISPVNQYKARAIRRGASWTAMMYMPAKFSKYKESFLESIEKQIPQDFQLYTDPVRVKVKYFYGTKRKKDLPNAGKLEFDALNGVVYKDDSQIFKIESEKTYDKTNPRIELEIYKYPEAQWG